MKNSNPYAAIAGAIGGTTIGMVALIVLFADSYEWTVVPVVLFMSILGMVLGKYASGKENKKA